MQRQDRSLVKVSTKLRLGLGPDNERISNKDEVSPWATPDNMKQQSRNSSSRTKSKMSSGEEERQTAAKQAVDLDAYQKQLQEREHYERLMEREHYQMQDTIKYYRDIEKERTNMFEQLVNQVTALDDAYFEIHMLQGDKRRMHEIILVQHAEKETLRQEILQLLQEKVEQTCEVSTLSSGAKTARDTIMASAFATRSVPPRKVKKEHARPSGEPSVRDSSYATCPQCQRKVAFCCPHCRRQSIPVGPGVHSSRFKGGKCTTSKASAVSVKFRR